MTKTRVLTLIFLIGLISFASCRKKPETIGSGLQPSSSLITVHFDSSQDVKGSTYKITELASTNLNFALLGNMNDPIFGVTNCDFYTQMSLTTESQTWGDNAVTDSISLFLTYNGYYGDTTEYLSVRVYELADTLYSDSTYYSSMSVAYYPEILGDMYFTPRPLTAPDTILDRGVLRIPLNPSLGAKFIENENYFESSTLFKQLFNGLYIECEQTNAEGAVCYFNLTHSYTCMRVYYHNSTDTLYYDFGITSSDVYFNHYEHDYTNSEITFYDTVSNNKLYLQGASGSRAWIKFPNIKEWADSLNGHVVINEAKLILTGAVTDTNLYIPPASFLVAGANLTDTTGVVIPDQTISSAYYGGTYNAEDAQVWWRITEYVQAIVSKGSYEDTDGLFVYVYNGNQYPYRWAFYGPEGETPIRLEIVYSLLND